MPDNSTLPPLPKGVVLKDTPQAAPVKTPVLPPLPKGVTLKDATPPTPQPAQQPQQPLTAQAPQPQEQQSNNDPFGVAKDLIASSKPQQPLPIPDYHWSTPNIPSDKDLAGQPKSQPDLSGDPVEKLVSHLHEFQKTPIATMVSPVAFDMLANAIHGTNEGTKQIANTPDVATKEGNVLGTVNLAAGLLKTGLSIASVTNPMVAAFSGGQIAAEKIPHASDVIEPIMSPFETIAQKDNNQISYNGRVYNLTEGGKSALELADLAWNAFIFAKGGKLVNGNVDGISPANHIIADKIRLNETLTPDETKTVSDALNEQKENFNPISNETLSKIPPGMPDAKKIQVAPLVEHNDDLRKQNVDLTAQKETLAPEFHPLIDENIKNNEQTITDNTDKVQAIIKSPDIEQPKPQDNGVPEVQTPNDNGANQGTDKTALSEERPASPATEPATTEPVKEIPTQEDIAKISNDKFDNENPVHSALSVLNDVIGKITEGKDNRVGTSKYQTLKVGDENVGIRISNHHGYSGDYKLEDGGFGHYIDVVVSDKGWTDNRDSTPQYGITKEENGKYVKIQIHPDDVSTPEDLTKTVNGVLSDINNEIKNINGDTNSTQAAPTGPVEEKVAGENEEKTQDNATTNNSTTEVSNPAGELQGQTESEQTDSGSSEVKGSTAVGDNTGTEGEPDKAKVEGEPTLTGVSHESMQKESENLGIEAPERGEGTTAEEEIAKGRELLSKGADPEKVLSDFEKDKKISSDSVSIVRAQKEKLAKDAKTAERLGVDNPGYKQALANLNDWNHRIKPLLTEWHKIGEGLQGETDVDTGSYTGLHSAYTESFGKEPDAKTAADLKEASDKVKSLTDEVNGLTKKLADVHQKSANEADIDVKKKSDKRIKKQADRLAQHILDKALIHKPGIFASATPASLVWDGAVKVVAKTIRTGGDIAQAIYDGLGHIKSSDWYKGLTDDNKSEAEKAFKDWHEKEARELPKADLTLEEKRLNRLNKEYADLLEGKIKNKGGVNRVESPQEVELKEKIQDAKEQLGLIPARELPKAELSEEDKRMELAGRFADKKDSKFTPQDSHDIWAYAKRNYFDKDGNYDFGTMLNGVATDLGLNTVQIRDALTLPKTAKRIVDVIYEKRYLQQQAIARAKQLVKNEKGGYLTKGVLGIAKFFFQKAIFGHGHAGMITHAGGELYDPPMWKSYFRNTVLQFKNAYGNKGEYQKRMDDLMATPNYVKAKRAGLQNDPTKAADDYQEQNSFIPKWMNKVLEVGDRGFNTLKVFRQDIFDHYYDQLPESLKEDPEALKNIAQLANAATGYSDYKSGKIVSTGLFATKLLGSRVDKIFVRPAKALETGIKLSLGKDVAEAEKVDAKRYAKRTGIMLATYAGALAVNQGLLAVSGSKDKINVTDPTSPDFLAFKAGDKTIGVSAGVVPMIRFVAGLFTVATESQKALNGKKRGDKFENILGNYLSNQLSPSASTVKDFITQHDFSGNTMPFSDDKPSYKDAHKLSWSEYLLESQTPIPIADAVKTVYTTMENQGVPKPKVDDILNGILMGVIASTGARVGDEPKPKAENSTPIPRNN